MAQISRRRGGGFPILPVLVVLLLLGGLVALAVMEPPYRPARVEQAVPSERLPL